MFLWSGELEKPTMFVSLEFLAPRLLTDLNKSRSLMSVPNVVFSTFVKLEMTTSHILLIAKLPQLAPSSLEEPPKMSWMKWRGIFMIAWVSPRICTLIQD
jgi:hypothetical protein